MRTHLMSIVGAVSLVVVGCSDDGGSSGPTGPSVTSCRTYATSYVQAGSVAGMPLNDAQTCSFDEASNQLRCTLTRNGATGCGTSIATYPTKAAFVDEVRVVPPLNLMTSYAVSLQDACGGGGGTVTYTYQGQRQTGFVDGAVVGVYTSWDTADRPTAGTFTLAGITTTQTIVYNEGARTATTTSISSGGTTTQTYEYDSRGLIVRTALTAAGVSGASTVTTNATGQVCK